MLVKTDPAILLMTQAIERMTETADPVNRILNLYEYRLGDGRDTTLQAGMVRCDSLSQENQWKIAFHDESKHNIFDSGRTSPWSLRNWYAHHNGNMLLRYYKTFIDLEEYEDLEKSAIGKLFQINSHMLKAETTKQVPQHVPLDFEKMPLVYNVALYNNLGLMMEAAKQTGEYAAIQEPFTAHQASLLTFMKAENDLIMAVADDYYLPSFVVKAAVKYAEQTIPNSPSI